MKQIVQQQKNGRLEVADVPAPMLQPQGVLVQTAFSLISAGTERAKVEVAQKSLLGKAMARPDQVRQVVQTYQQLGFQATYQKVVNKLEALSPLGYSTAGIVVAVGEQVTGLKVGDKVACAGGGYASHAEIIYVPQNLCAPVPSGVPLAQAAYTTLGAIAMQGVRQAEPALGETVGVIGLGLLGLLTVQLLRAAGCRVVGLDVNPVRCTLARELGADVAASPHDADLEAEARRYSPAGLDAVILTAATRSSDPIVLAAHLARERARLVVVGAVGMDIPRSPFYEKELEVRLSRSYGPGRYDPEYEEKGRDYPIGYVRWTEGRNMVAFLGLLAQGKLDMAPLTTHCYPVEEAETAYQLIQGEMEAPFLGVLLDYGVDEAVVPEFPTRTPIRVTTAAGPPRPVVLALLGAGSFAQSMLLPHLQKNEAVSLRLVVTPSGLTARSVAEKAGFALCAADPETALVDEQVNLVVIASRHDSHADLVRRSLQAGKSVFVEKPLALTPTQLAEVTKTYAELSRPFVMVGFNRRFAPLVRSLRTFLAPVGEPMLLYYRVNAGYIPPDHWIQDREIGGGRLVGEVCHFVDLLLHLVRQPVTQVFAYGLPDGGRYNQDNITAVLRFADGSVGTILYAANGDKRLPKERIEVFAAGKAAVLDDFRQLTLVSNGKQTVEKSRPDKGHGAEMAALVTAVQRDSDEPVPFSESVLVTQTMFAIATSLATGEPVSPVS